MCGRYTLTANLRVIQEHFDLANEDMKELLETYRQDYNVAPTRMVATLVQDGDRRKAKLMRWGLVPVWAPDEKIGFKMINARSEELMEKKSFKPLLTKNRCLILADGFYEFRTEGKAKFPVRFIRSDKKPFAFAGLYTHWKKSPEETITSCTILTTSPNAIVEKVHNRMPVILQPEGEKAWLNPALKTYDELKPLMVSYPEALMTAYDVHPAVNNVKNNGEHLIEPFDPRKEE